MISNSLSIDPIYGRLSHVLIDCPAQSLLTAREFYDPLLLACAGMAVNIHSVHPEQAELLLGASQLRPRSDFGRLMLLVPEPLAGARALMDRAQRVLHL